MDLLSYQSELMLTENDVTYRLERVTRVTNGLDTKYEYAYDINGNETLFISYDWDTATQSFVPIIKAENIFDINGNNTLYINYDWDTATQSFVPDFKVEHTTMSTAIYRLVCTTIGIHLPNLCA